MKVSFLLLWVTGVIILLGRTGLRASMASTTTLANALAITLASFAKWAQRRSSRRRRVSRTTAKTEFASSRQTLKIMSASVLLASQVRLNETFLGQLSQIGM